MSGNEAEIHLKFHYADEENICVWKEWKAHSHNILRVLIVFCIIVAHFPPNLIQFKIYSKLLFVVSAWVYVWVCVFFFFFFSLSIRVELLWVCVVCCFSTRILFHLICCCWCCDFFFTFWFTLPFHLTSNKIWNWFRIFEIFVQDPLWRLVIIIIEIAMKWRKIIASVSL